MPKAITTIRGKAFFFFLLLLLLVIIAFVSAAPRKRKNGNPLARNIRILNHSGAKIDVFWINPTTRELADSNTDGEGIMYGGETGIASYAGHNFEVQELQVNGKCKRHMCRKAYFTVTENEDQCE